MTDGRRRFRGNFVVCGDLNDKHDTESALLPLINHKGTAARAAAECVRKDELADRAPSAPQDCLTWSAGCPRPSGGLTTLPRRIRTSNWCVRAVVAESHRIFASPSLCSPLLLLCL